jgi:hypothetical protein
MDRGSRQFQKLPDSSEKLTKILGAPIRKPDFVLDQGAYPRYSDMPLRDPMPDEGRPPTIGNGLSAMAAPRPSSGASTEYSTIEFARSESSDRRQTATSEGSVGRRAIQVPFPVKPVFPRTSGASVSAVSGQPGGPVGSNHVAF